MGMTKDLSTVLEQQEEGQQRGCQDSIPSSITSDSTTVIDMMEHFHNNNNNNNNDPMMSNNHNNSNSDDNKITIQIHDNIPSLHRPYDIPKVVCMMTTNNNETTKTASVVPISNTTTTLRFVNSLRILRIVGVIAFLVVVGFIFVVVVGLVNNGRSISGPTTTAAPAAVTFTTVRDSVLANSSSLLSSFTPPPPQAMMRPKETTTTTTTSAGLGRNLGYGGCIRDMDDYARLFDLSYKRLVVIFFTSESCEACPTLDITFKTVGRTYGARRGEFVYVDVEEVPDAAQTTGVTVVPSVLLIQDGKPVAGGLLVNPRPDKLWKTVETQVRSY